MVVKHNRLSAFKNLFINMIDKESNLQFFQDELNRNKNDIERLRLDLITVKTDFQNVSTAISLINNKIESLRKDKALIIKKQEKKQEKSIVDKKSNEYEVILKLIDLINIEDFITLKYHYKNYKKFLGIPNFIEFIESNESELSKFFEIDNSDLLDSIIYSDTYSDTNPFINPNIRYDKELVGVEKTNAIQKISQNIRTLIEEVRQKTVIYKGYNERLRVLTQKRFDLDKTRVELERTIISETHSLRNLTDIFHKSPLRFYKTKSYSLNHCIVHNISVLKISQLSESTTGNNYENSDKKFYNVFIEFYKENPDFLFMYKNIKYAISSVEDFRINERKKSDGTVFYTKKVGSSHIDIRTYYNEDKNTINHLIQMIEDR